MQHVLLASQTAVRHTWCEPEQLNPVGGRAHLLPNACQHRDSLLPGYPQGIICGTAHPCEGAAVRGRQGTCQATGSTDPKHECAGGQAA